MKTILATINAKYIHTSLALRLLYVVSNTCHDVEIKEYTLKENISTIANDLLSSCPEVIALGVYIWNVEQTKSLIEEILKIKPNTIIIIGGPEVTYEPDFFIQNWNIDFVIRGEGEFVLRDLLTLINESKTDISQIRLDATCSKNYTSEIIAQVDLNKLENYPSPYTLEIDTENKKNKILYFETSRGCPYSCQYCLSSLEKGVRYFSKSYIVENLRKIIASEVKTIKFLDRTFNLNKSHTETVYDCLIDNYRPNLSCQFEIYADILDSDTIRHLSRRLPDNYFRFEIGIQSTHEPTNIAVKRKQNFALIQKNINQIMSNGKIDLHLDLIAGLPHETLELFEISFNEVFDFGAKEIQLGFLKMLRGTNLRKDASKYNYTYDTKAPYEISANEYISEVELAIVHDVEEMVDKYWNSGKFQHTLNHVLFQFFKNNYFLFFKELAKVYNEKTKEKTTIRLEDLFTILNRYLTNKNINIFSILRQDYYNNYCIRPHGFWDSILDKTSRKRLLYEISNDKEFLKKHGLNRKTIEKQMTIDILNTNEFLLTHFDGISKNHKEYIYTKSTQE